ncbi:methyltransferase domain-containing protein [Rhizobium halophilum]|uniref:methyltransferase domain-containing protein n=1 Tax=Rhizobium halophilum TaxID=2846852 RepID=UPI001EFC9F2D|nr:methyltransferase domain-containing protein [Rhizobium halophilum]MCF6369503.1 class I SAM-dependent methyltransferase [Rhizobium halophilum]
MHHFAPERSLYVRLSARHTNPNYFCYDFFPEIYAFAKEKISKHDLCDTQANQKLPLADVIIHNHVLEHLPVDWRRVLRELNSRLMPGGLQAITVPTRRGRFDEDLSDLPPEERKRRFAQEDHMRIFGDEDVIGMMAAEGMKPFRISHYLSPDLASVFGVKNSYDLDAAGRAGGSTVFYRENI